MMIPFTNDDGLRDYRHPLVEDQPYGRLSVVGVLIMIIVTLCLIEGAILLWWH